MSSVGVPLTTAQQQRYGAWVAPKADGALLIWPEVREISSCVHENVTRLMSGRLSIGDVPLPELRRAARGFLGHHDDRPLVATGHQCELHHPGVWVKNAVICEAARACGGVALHVAVDTDAPKHLRLKWPGFSANLSDDPHINAAPWIGLVEPPTPAHLGRLIEAAETACEAGQVGSLLPGFLRSFRAFLVDQRDAVAPVDLPNMLANAQHQLDWSLDLQYTEILLSGLLQSEPWGHFALHLLKDAPRFASSYNAALAAYRREAGIVAPDRPMPDLGANAPHIEVPFWLDELATGRRHRAEVLREGSGLVLAAPGGDRLVLVDAAPRTLLQWLRQRQLRLAPRALSLTLFLRLCVCDLFVHGIGGGHYDQVTDRIISDYFRLEPPGFAVATATLVHAAAAGRERVCLPCLEHEGHQLAHRVLGSEKSQWLARIDAATGFHARRAVFDQMHAARHEALATDPSYAAWQRRLSDARERATTEAELFDRELFYAVQPEQRLRAIVDRVRNAFAAT